VLAAAVVLAACAGAGAAPTGVAACADTNTQVWLGDGEGGGTAGAIYYPLEFSNVGHRACTLYGYPGVSAWGSGGGPVGLAATRAVSAHTTVTLAPNATAHALLRIADYGALCSTALNALGLAVYAPGQRQSRSIEFALEVCAHRSVLSVGPVRAGVGIPGYTTS